MISDLDGSLGCRYFLKVANEKTFLASCVCALIFFLWTFALIVSAHPPVYANSHATSCIERYSYAWI